MSGDPFRNYDQWLEAPYQEQADREALQEYIDEHSTVECSTCGTELGLRGEVELTTVTDPAWKNSYQTAPCPKCGEECEVNIVEPEPDE